MDITTLFKKAKQGDKEPLVKLLMSQKNDFYKLAYLYMKNGNINAGDKNIKYVNLYQTNSLNLEYVNK